VKSNGTDNHPRTCLRDEHLLHLSDSRQMTSGGVAGAGICIAISLAFAALSPACAHWFLIPVTLCAWMLVQDVADWLTQRMDIFDPSGLVGIFGLHFFFLVPILHVHLDFWIPDVIPPSDWRPWIGYMAILNLLGLTVYKAINQRRPRLVSPLRKQWHLNARKFVPFALVAMLGCLTLQALIYRHFGGISGYMAAYDSRAVEGGFEGMGTLFLFSENFPLLAFMLYAVAARKRAGLRGWGAILLVLVAFVALKMVFGGLRGSRSNTVYGLLWVAGIVHFWIRPLTRKMIFAGLIVVIGYIYLYGFYKAFGLESVAIIRDAESRSARSAESGRTISGILLWDLGRSDVQAYLLYRLTDPESTFRLRWGKTYVHWLTLKLPAALKLDLEGKREAGSEAQYGFISNDLLSSRMYGLAGEAMLNFGAFASPFAFALLGWLVVKTRRLLYLLPRHDPRLFMVPFLVVLAIVIPGSDMNNVEFLVFKHGLMPFALIWLCSRTTPFKASDGRKAAAA
jgi:hypothetical protein